MKEQLIILGFIAGLFFCATHTNKSLMEGFSTSNRPPQNKESDCPNLLIKKGNKLMLLNNRKARIPGINPIFFDNLEDYVEFNKWQRSQDIKCPVLYFNEMQDAQGNTKFRMLNDPLDPQAGLPSYGPMATEVPLYDSNMDHPPYNQNNYHGFDPTNQNTGRYTSLDKVFYSNKKRNSADAMKMNWAGAESSRRMVRSGKYDKNFRPKAKFSKFKGITIAPPQQNNAPNSAGAKTQDAQIDRQLKQQGQLK
jgi:hypothetical protein